MGTPATASPLSTTLQPDVIVIHHLADVGHEPYGRSNSPLAEYAGRINLLQRLQLAQARKYATSPPALSAGTPLPPPEERAPDLVIITGSMVGRRPNSGPSSLLRDWETDALARASEILRGIFEQDGSGLSESVFIVPGPRDLDWMLRTNPLGPFLREFDGFGTFLSSTTNQSTYRCIEPALIACSVHLLDTMLTPDDLRAFPDKASIPLDNLLKEFRALLVKYPRAQQLPFRLWQGESQQNRWQRDMLQELEQLWALLDAGRVRQEDLDAFSSQLTRSAQATGALGNRLKILVTHHPIRAERAAVLPGAPAGREQPTRYADVLDKARQAGFHLAFHTDGVQATVLAELPTYQPARPALRQIGAPSLQRTGIYNEIYATREQGSAVWRIEARPIRLSDPPDSAPTLILLNTLAQSVPAAPVQPNAEAAARKELEQRVRTALRQLAEEVASGQPDIPSTPLTTLRDAVDEVIFRDFTVGNIGLALKRTSGFSKVELVSDFITDEDWNDGRFLYPFVYPTSPAAWALILGKILTCSQRLSTANILGKDDMDWLNNTGRRARVLDLLEQQVDLAGKLAVDPATRAEKVQRATRLRDGFGQNTLNLQDTADYPTQTLSGKIEEVIYVPVPHRTTAGNVQDLPEMGALVIEVGAAKAINGQVPPPQPILTPEREDMLTTISDAMYGILATANELRRPPGSWRRLP